MKNQEPMTVSDFREMLKDLPGNAYVSWVDGAAGIVGYFYRDEQEPTSELDSGHVYLELGGCRTEDEEAEERYERWKEKRK